MLLTVTTTHRPATDLGYLLHKHPDRVHERDLPFGRAYVVYPEATEERCTAALVVDVDPVGLVRGRDGSGGGGRRGRGGRGGSAPQGHDGSLAQYVNDRPYAASSFLSVAIGKLLGTALGGRSTDRPDLPATPLPLAVRLPVLPVRGGEPLLRRLFEPLGHTVAATPLPLDATFPEWGDSRYLDVTLTTTACLRDVLEHLFVLLPVLDDDKHYWVGAEEVDKLLRRAGRWLADHPDRELITRRYLRHDRRLATDALARLLADDPGSGDGPDAAALEGRDRAHDEQEAEVERPISLNEQRMAAVVAAVERAGARTVVDLGCGPGQLVGRLLRDTQVARVVGVDVSHRALEAAARRLHLATMTPRQRERVDLWQGALTYRDRRLEGFDLATVVEVVEHLDPPRLGAFERALFVHARPRAVVVTTPNVEHNVRFPSLPAGSLRHRDHRFEWTRAEFAAWAAGVAGRHGYGVEHHGIGAEDDEVGPPTQMAVFTR